MKMQAGFTIAISLRTDVSPSFASVSLGYVSSGAHHNGAMKLSQLQMRLKTDSPNYLKCLFWWHQKEQAIY